MMDKKTNNISQEFLNRTSGFVLSYSDVQNTLQRATEITKEEKYKRVLVVFVDDDNGSYDLHTLGSGLKCSELVTLCEVVKNTAIEQMGF